MAMSSRAAACAALTFPSTTAAAPPSSVSVNRRAQPRKAMAAVARATSAGGAVLDPPAFDQSQLDTLPPAQEGAHPATPNRIKSSHRFELSISDARDGCADIALCTASSCRRGHGEAQGPEGHRQRRQLLLDDPRHTEKHVETALPQVVPSVTAEAARQLFHESRQKGAALVIVAVKEHAEFYAQMMVRHGLRSAIEPESDMAT